MRNWFQTLPRGDGLAGILAAGSVLCAVFLGFHALPPTLPALPPSPTPESTPIALSEPADESTPSPTPSGVELAGALADNPADEEARVPAFLRSGHAPSPRVAEVAERLRSDPFASERGAEFLPGAGTARRGNISDPADNHSGGAEITADANSTRGMRGDARLQAKAPIPLPGQLSLELPDEPEADEPPPAGRARLRTGSIPVERQLWIDGKPVSSFQLAGTTFLPGIHQVRLEGARGCIQFSVRLQADENVLLIWDFDTNGWRRAERIGASGRAASPLPVGPCAGGTP